MFRVFKLKVTWLVSFLASFITFLFGFYSPQIWVLVTFTAVVF